METEATETGTESEGPPPHVGAPKPYVVEVTIDAPPDAVWRAVSDPAEIRRWFGWDYAKLDEEVRYIFIDHATHQPPQRLEWEGMMQALDIVPDGSRTVVRLVCAGGLAGAEWDDVYDAMEEGWRTFFHQLKYYLERHAGEDRRTFRLAGTAPAPAVSAALDAAAPGRQPWQESRYQRAFVTADGGHLVSLLSSASLSSDEPAKVALTVSTYGLDDAAFDALRASWEARWTPLVADGDVTLADTEIEI